MQVYVVPREESTEFEGGLPPAPLDPSVSLEIGGGGLVAARRFEGNATQDACLQCLKELKDALKRGTCLL
jgi:hypothetical protein